MRVPLFLVRSWYFLAVAVVGTLHITIPLGLATWQVAERGEAVTRMAFAPVLVIGLVWLNISAMRAVIRSFGLTGEPDFVKLVQTMVRHVAIDLGVPVLLAGLIGLALAGVVWLDDPGRLLADPWVARGELIAIGESLRAWAGMPAILLANAATLALPIGALMLCAAAVPLAAGAVGASASGSGHMPGYGFGSRTGTVMLTLAVNLTILWGLGHAFGALDGFRGGFDAAGLAGRPAGALMAASYFVVMATAGLAYCDHRGTEARENAALRDFLSYGARRETADDFRALRLARMKA